MTSEVTLPRLLIIDDITGRKTQHGRNEDRDVLCIQFQLRDITGDQSNDDRAQIVANPIAEAFFARGQRPVCAHVGDIVENDLEGTLDIVRDGWLSGGKGNVRWSLVILDLCFLTGRVVKSLSKVGLELPEGQQADMDEGAYFGLRILQEILKELPDIPVVILSGMPRDAVSRKFTSMGAVAFLERDTDDAASVLRDYIWRHALITDDKRQIVGSSIPLLKLLRSGRRSASGMRNILIRGDRGTGKELFARYIHRQSRAGAARPLEIVDSGALVPELYSSELFGHYKGAFTGADSSRVGKISRANGGDLFLDEIGNMPFDVQSGLLRVIESGIVTPIGAQTGTAVSVRFLSATNENLEAAAAVRKVREDLLDRLCDGGTIFIPPLSERIEDIPCLVESFLRQAEEEIRGSRPRKIDQSAIDAICTRSWPGNIRQLKACIFNAVVDYPDVDYLLPSHLSLGFQHSDGRRISGTTRNVENNSSESWSTVSSTAVDLEVETNPWSAISKTTPIRLVGSLPMLEIRHLREVADLLEVALELTSRRTMHSPDGEPNLQGAVRLVTGDDQIGKSIPGRFFRNYFARCHKFQSAVIRDILGSHPLLSLVYSKYFPAGP